jgi:hypothetical protein
MNYQIPINAMKIIRPNLQNIEFLDIKQFSNDNTVFSIGDTVRSYRCGFDNDKPYKNNFIEGVVIGIESWIKPNDYIKVKWQIQNYFGTVYPFKMPHDGSDTFTISVNSPWLVKVNSFQLAFAF